MDTWAHRYRAIHTDTDTRTPTWAPGHRLRFTDTHTDSGRAGLGQGWASPGIPRATQPSHVSTGYREGFLWKRGRDNGQFMSRKFVLTEREGALKYFNRIDVSVAAMPPWDPRELTG